MKKNKDFNCIKLYDALYIKKDKKRKKEKMILIKVFKIN